MTLAVYLMFCPVYAPANCEWLGFSSSSQCGRVVDDGNTPYGEGKILVKCFLKDSRS